MPEKRNSDPKQLGFLGIFKRKQSPSPPINARSATVDTASTASKPKKEQHKSPARRAYKPRHAERDFVLSIPVEHRPDLVAKANEARLQRVCSDIGFSSASSSRGATSQYRAGSHDWQTRHTPSHPNLRLQQQAEYDTMTAGTSVGSSASSTHNRAVSRSVIQAGSRYTADAYWYRSTSPEHRPNATPRHGTSAIPQSTNAETEGLGQAFRELGLVENDSDKPSQSALSSSYTAHASHRLQAAHATTRERAPYFSHNTPKGKGKGKVVTSLARPPSVAGSSDYGDENSDQDYINDRESYVLRTQAPTYRRAQSAHPGMHYSDPVHIVSPPGAESVQVQGHLYTPSVVDADSSGSSFADSFDVKNEFWTGERHPSSSTLRTAWTDSSEARGNDTRYVRTSKASNLASEGEEDNRRTPTNLHGADGDMHKDEYNNGEGHLADDNAESTEAAQSEVLDADLARAMDKVKDLPGAW